MDLLERDPRPPLTEAPPRGTAAWSRSFAWFLLGATAARLLYLAAGPLDLSPDEAHYWEWSRRLDLSYYSKGPLVAYLIAALTGTLGISAFAIRLGAVTLSLGGALVTHRLAREAFGDPRVGVLAVVGLQLTPLFWAGSLVMTTDPPFLVAWVGALWLLHRALVQDRAAAWLLAGLAVGLGVLAKYAMLFVLPGLGLYLLTAPGARAWLGRPAPYAGAAIAALLSSPVVVWNVQYGWLSARHVASQGRGAGWSLLTLAQFLGSQLGVLTPLVAALLGWAAWYGVREGLVRGREPYRFLTAFAAPVLAVYLGLALQGKVQANWAVAAYPPLALIAAGALLERHRHLAGRAWKRQTALLVAAGGLALVVTALGHLAPALPLPPRLDPTARLRGWRDLGLAVAAQRREMPAPDRTFLLSDRYQVTSELAFYVDGHPPAYNVNLGRRLNQYDVWPGPDSRIGWDALYVRDGTGQLDALVVRAFERIEGPYVVAVPRDRAVRIFMVYRGYGFQGMGAPPGPPKY